MTETESNSNNLAATALAQYHAGDLTAAELLCRRAVQIDPGNIHGLHVLGFVLAAQGELAEAIERYRQALALRADMADIHNNLGVALAAVGKSDEAIAQYREALAINPDYLDSMVNLAIALAARNELEEAISLYRRVIEIQPDHHAAYNNLGAALVAMKRIDEGMAAYREAIRLKPGYSHAHNNLGVALWELNRQDAALEAYRSAVQADPNHAAAHNNIGNYYLANGRVAEAIETFKIALGIQPNFVDAYCNLGIALMENGDYVEALAVFERAHAIAPDAIEPHWNLSGHALLHGDFRRGWLEYEWRWQTKSRSASRINYPQPNWYGEELSGRKILLYTEQGFGDSIQFIRYATLVARRGGRVILQCLPKLAGLIKGVAGIERVVTTEEPLPEFDLYLPLMSLPLVFATRLESIPADVPYINVEPALIDKWRAKVEAASGGRLKVGLVWAGGPGYINDRKRSIMLAQLAPLAATPETAFFSLQMGNAAAQAADGPAVKLVDLTADIDDFSDTAALILNLDLVIAVDTAVAHLAGALGRPVWLMIPQNPDWRWLLNRDDSPWYPTMRLFRQTKRGEWTDVIERVAKALGGLQTNSHATAALPDAASVPRKLTTADAFSLAWQHHLAGRFSEAAGIYRQIIAQQPRNTDALHLMGLAALEARRPEMAVEWISRAIAINASIPDYHHNLGLAQAAGENFNEAIDAYRNVIRLNPEFPDVFYNLGNALLKLKRYDDAVEAYQHAVKLAPDHFESHLNLGQALAHLSRHEEAVDVFKHAISLNPNHAEAYMNLGLALMLRRQIAAAFAAARRALEIDPNSIDSHWLMAALCLLTGDFERGLKEYEWRWKREDPKSPRVAFTEPRWDGGDLHGKTILLHAEQGLGDTIQFIRYAPLVADRGGRVIVQCPPVLSRLLKSVRGISEIVESAAGAQFDVQCPLMSLPLAFGTTLESIPAELPVVRADIEDEKRWAARIAAEYPAPPGTYKIGLVWAGRPAFKDDLLRSITLAQFAPLADIPNAMYYSLQKGPAASQAANPPQGMNLIDLTSDLKDFADTAALISQLDLVISVDTAVAHLAGSLGKPVWVMIPFNPDWRWMFDREDTPWYPTMRLFRQRAPGDWESVVERIADELRAEMKAM